MNKISKGLGSLLLASTIASSAIAQSKDAWSPYDIEAPSMEQDSFINKYEWCEKVQEVTESMCKIIIDCGGTLKVKDNGESSYVYDVLKKSEFNKCIVESILSGKHDTNTVLNTKK